MGRRKIEIQPLTDDRNRTVTFVKRKAGLFKKAHELAVLCQVDLAVIIVGNNNKLYEFSSVDTNELIDMYQKTPKKHESKSPANYGNYKRKKHLAAKSLGVINDDEFDNDDDNYHDHDDNYHDHDNEDNDHYNDNNEEDDDSETPEPRPKRQKRGFEEMARRPGPGAGSRTRSGASGATAANTRPQVSLPNVPNLNSFRNSNSIIKEEEEEDYTRDANPYRHDSINSTSTTGNFGNQLRPILRVQIPTDAKGSANDSARTLTALDTNPNPTQSSASQAGPNSQASQANSQANSQTLAQNAHDSTPDSARSTASGGNPTSDTGATGANGANNGTNGPHIASKYSSFSNFRSPDTRKPITTLPIPIQSKSQTSSPSSATAPPLPVSGMTSFFLPQPSPSSQYPNSSVPTPILNQVFNDPKFRYQHQQHPQHQHHGPQQHQNQHQQTPPHDTNTPEQSQISQASQGQPQPSQPQGQPGQPQPQNPGQNPSHPNEPPMSGLPSKYVNDIFPSPSNFYVPQDWPNSGTGMTPVHNNLPQYFMNMIPNQQANQPPSRSHSQSNQFPITPGIGARPGPPQANNSSDSESQPPSHPPSDPPAPGLAQKPPAQSTRSSQGLNYQFPSPLQFMSPSFQEEKK